MTPQDRLLSAALAFCHEDAALSRARKASQKCELASRPEPEIGHSGDLPCWQIPDEVDEICGPCKARMANDYKGSLRKRQLAKRRMLRAFAAIPIPSDSTRNPA